MKIKIESQNIASAINYVKDRLMDFYSGEVVSHLSDEEIHKASVEIAHNLKYNSDKYVEWYGTGEDGYDEIMDNGILSEEFADLVWNDNYPEGEIYNYLEKNYPDRMID